MGVLVYACTYTYTIYIYILKLKLIIKVKKPIEKTSKNMKIVNWLTIYVFLLVFFYWFDLTIFHLRIREDRNLQSMCADHSTSAHVRENARKNKSEQESADKDIRT